jgi:glucosyl-3-phosphoglycerate phosphatase
MRPDEAIGEPAGPTPGRRRIVLVRHGRTDWSADRYMGRQDTPLNAAGRAEADRVVAALADETVVAIWSSPLRRATQTSAPLGAARGLDVTEIGDLVEMDFGRAQGALKAERRVHVKEDHVHTPVPGGESLAEVARRAGRVADLVIRQGPSDGTLVVVSHYRVSQFLLGALLARPFADVVAEPRYRPENGSAYALDCRVERGGRLTVHSEAWLIGDGPP